MYFLIRAIFIIVQRGLWLIFNSKCVNGAVRLFSEHNLNQKSVAGIDCGGRIWTADLQVMSLTHYLVYV